MYNFPSAMTGADWPGKGAVHSAAFASTFSGNPVSRVVPAWSGPRHWSQPRTAA